MRNKRNVRKPKGRRATKGAVEEEPNLSGTKQQKHKAKKPEQNTRLSHEEKLEIVRWVDKAEGDEEKAVLGIILKAMPEVFDGKETPVLDVDNMSYKLQREILNYIHQCSVQTNLKDADASDPQSSRHSAGVRRSSRIARPEPSRPGPTRLLNNKPPSINDPAFPDSNITVKEFEAISNEFLEFLQSGEYPDDAMSPQVGSEGTSAETAVSLIHDGHFAILLDHSMTDLPTAIVWIPFNRDDRAEHYLNLATTDERKRFLLDCVE